MIMTGESSNQSLYDMQTICVDENDNWHRPEYPQYQLELAPPKPFLVPSFNDDEVVEVLPSEKKDQKIQWSESVDVMDIENRFQLMEGDEWDEDDASYEIEIVEGGGGGGNSKGGKDDDADFYLEMIDGEIFYVFETEDDISVEDEYESSSDSSSYSDEEDSETQTSCSGGRLPLQLNIGDLMMAPNLSGDGDSIPQLDTSGLQMTDELVVAETPPTTTTTQDEEETAKLEDKQLLAAMDALLDTTNKKNDAETTPPESPTRAGGGRAKFDTPPISPARTTSSIGSTSRPSSPGTPRSILKACPPSPTRPKRERKDKKSKNSNKDGSVCGNTKKEKKEKTFSKTLVRASDFDGEHRVYSWAKPNWAKEQKLRSTGKGGDIRKGGNLANPITDAKQLIEKGKVKWEKPEWADSSNRDDNDDDGGADLCAKQELIRKIQEGSMNLPGTQKKGQRLKLSINGSILKEGGNLAKPITKATIIKKPANINTLANPKILRATPGGAKLWKGENLAGHITQATQEKKYQWEKPSWVNAKLKGGDRLGQDSTKCPITPSKKKKHIEWEKPDWTKKRGTISRSKSSDDLEEDIGTKKSYEWEKPSWVKAKLKPTDGNNSFREGALKQTEEGDRARNGTNLAKPITQLPHLSEEEKRAARSVRRSRSEE